MPTSSTNSTVALVSKTSARSIHVIHRNELERHPKVRMGHTGVRLRKATPLFYSWSEKKPKENFVLWNARGPEAANKVRG